jgi:hypothetical protein
VKAILENRLPPPTAAALSKKDSPYPAAFAAARLIDPGVDPVVYTGRVAGARDAATKGAAAGKAMNQAVEHQGDVLIGAMNDLNASQYPYVNSVKNWWNGDVMGHGEVGGFKTAAHAAVDEMAKIFKGAGISDTEIKHWEDNLPANMSPEQMRTEMRTFAKLMRGGFDAMEQQRRVQIGPYAAARAEPFLGEQGKAALAKLEAFGASGDKPTKGSPNSDDLFKFLPIGK